MRKLESYKKKIRKLSEKKFYKESVKVSRRIEKYQRRIKELRGERGLGLIRFLWRDHGREERLENWISRRLEKQKSKLDILKEESKKLNYDYQEYFTSLQHPFSNYSSPH